MLGRFYCVCDCIAENLKVNGSGFVRIRSIVGMTERGAGCGDTSFWGLLDKTKVSGDVPEIYCDEYARL